MIASNIICHGVSRFLNTIYCQDISVSGTATFSSISATGDITAGGNLKSTTGNLYLKNLLAINGQTDSWLRINANNAFSSGTYFGTNIVRIDGTFQVGANGAAVNIYYGNNNTNKAMTVSIPATFNGTTTTISNLVAATGNISTLNATNVNVTNNLRANHYDLQTVAQLGGSFYVSPTVKFPNSGTTLTVAKSGSTLTLTITDSSITSTTMAGVVWAANSRVKVSGTINGVVTGTMDGTVSSINTGSHFITLSVSGENSASVVAGTYTASQFSDLTVMIYQRRDGSNDYRVGIWMNCYDIANSSSTIRIYGGSDANPNVMLGNLTSAGLGTVNNLTPTGWGLFAQNAFLHGKVVANGGLIGNWTIGTAGMYYNSDAPSSTSITMIPGGTTASSTSIGGSSGSKQWIFTGKDKFGVDTNGVLYAKEAVISGALTAGANSKIGPWNVTTTSIYKVSNTLGSTTSGAAYFGDLGLSVANKFKVDANGVATLGLSTGYHATMDTDSFDVLNGSTMLATFGETATIGNMSARGVSIDANGFKFNNGGEQNFFIGINSRSGDTISSATATVTNNSTQNSSLVDGVTYYRVASIASGQTVISVVGHFDYGVENEEELMFAAVESNVKSWVVDSGYLWVEDGYSSYSAFEETITYSYTTSSTSNLPYMVLGISVYDGDNIPGIMSFAQGYKNKATGSFSTAIGSSTVASGKGAFACGIGTTASGQGTFACGISTTASGNYSHSEGESTTASGWYSHSEGERTTASGWYSHSEGERTTASGWYSHSEGCSTVSSGHFSRSEGQGTTASGNASHAEGYHTKASEQYSHAQGYYTIASGESSHAEGERTISIGFASHAAGRGTVALHDYQFVIGKFNKATVSGSGTEADPYVYTNVGDYPFIIGKGSQNATNYRSNAFTVDWSGNVIASGSFTGTGATLTGALSGTSATFSSTISAAGATLTGALSGTSASFSSTLTATSTITGGSFSTTGSLTAAGATFNGAVSGTTASFTGDVLANKLIGASATLTGALIGISATFSGNVMAANTSHIGMIIMSTTLDTMAKVIAIYGGTTWIQHSGYMLRGATSGVTANSATSNGGAETVTLTVDQIPSHTHPNPSDGAFIINKSVTSGYAMAFASGSYNRTSASATGSRGGGQAHNNMPPYKNVYIWERTA